MTTSRVPPAVPSLPTVAPPTGSMFTSLGVAASALNAQRFRMQLTAQNLANIETTRTPEGGPYRRRIAELGTVASGAGGSGLIDGIEVLGVREDTSEGALVYNPANPDADASGYVCMPNVDMSDELSDLSDAEDMYKANVTVFQALRSMLQKATGI